MNASQIAGFMTLCMIPTITACEGQIQCQLCGGNHSTASHIAKDAADSGGVPGAKKMLPDDVLLGFVAQHHADGFEQVNKDPYASQVADAKINVFVSSFALPDYLETMPADKKSDGMIPRGSFVVREIVDKQGKVSKLTALYRGPKGYNPSSGDFWFAVTDPQGHVAKDPSGAPMAGPLATCSSCHAGRASSDFLFGVPDNVRFPRYRVPNIAQTPGTVGSDNASSSDTSTSSPGTSTNSDASTPSQPAAQQGSDDTQTAAAAPAPRIVELSGWTLSDVESDLTMPQTYTFDSLSVPAGTNVVVGRDATRDEFEAYWGPLPDGTIYVDAEQSGPFDAPVINGAEMWEVRNANGELVDGPTPTGHTNADYRRQSKTTSDFLEFAQKDATPGSVYAMLPAGVWLTEWSDADNYRMEFVELAVR